MSLASGRSVLLTLAIATAGLVSACGDAGRTGDDGAPEPAEPLGDVRGTAPATVGGVPVVVTARPLGAGDTPDAIAGASIDQFGLQFSPTRTFVGLGSPLTFTNSEGALAHNVNVRAVADGASLLDEDANVGDELTLTLEEEGGYDVLCGMHPGMSAFVFVTDDPYGSFVDPDGSFSLGELPAGQYALRLWTLDAGFQEPVTISVTVTGAEVELTASD